MPIDVENVGLIAVRLTRIRCDNIALLQADDGSIGPAGRRLRR